MAKMWALAVLLAQKPGGGDGGGKQSQCSASMAGAALRLSTADLRSTLLACSIAAPAVLCTHTELQHCFIVRARGWVQLQGLGMHVHTHAHEHVRTRTHSHGARIEIHLCAFPCV